jgi:hypothetical protein
LEKAIVLNEFSNSIFWIYFVVIWRWST